MIKEDFLRAVAGEVPNKPVVLPVAIDEFFVREFGITYHEYTYDADMAFQVWDYGIREYGLNAALIFVDDFFEYSTFGLEFTDEPNIPRACKKHVPATWEWVENTTMPTFDEEMFRARMKLVKALKEKYGEELLVCVSVAAPFTGASLLYGITETMMLFYDDVSLLKKTMEFTVKLSVECSRRLIEAGADMIWYGDLTASSKFIDLKKFKTYISELTTAAIEAIHSYGARVIYHANETNPAYLEQMARLGSDVVTCGEECDMAEVYDAVGEACCLMGNYDSIRNIMNGDVRHIAQSVRESRLRMKNRKRYIFNTGEGIPVVCSSENIKAFLAACSEQI